MGCHIPPRVPPQCNPGGETCYPSLVKYENTLLRNTIIHPLQSRAGQTQKKTDLNINKARHPCRRPLATTRPRSGNPLRLNHNVIDSNSDPTHAYVVEITRAEQSPAPMAPGTHYLDLVLALCNGDEMQSKVIE